MTGLTFSSTELTRAISQRKKKKKGTARKICESLEEKEG